MVRRCTNCSLPENFPGIAFNTEGLCESCEGYDPALESSNKLQAKTELDEVIEIVKSSTGQVSSYDCIVALSGGKDSSYMLKMLVEEWGLNCLAITVDNGFLSEQSIVNATLICDHVGVDYLLLKPSFTYMKDLYRSNLEGRQSKKSIIKRASDICNSCINLINAVMLKEALCRNVAMIAGGYIAGQVPKNSSVMRMHLSTLLGFSKSRVGGDNYFATETDFSRFTNGNSINIVNPFLAVDYNESNILSELQSIGWKRPDDTGAHSSNCRINDLGIINHQKKYGFHPYELELAEQVRSGSLSRQCAIDKIESEIDQERMASVIQVLELKS